MVAQTPFNWPEYKTDTRKFHKSPFIH